MKRKSDFNRIVSNISETLTNETLIKYVSNNVQLQNIIKKQLEIAFFMLKNNSSTKNEEKLRKISNSFANKYNVKINENLTFSEIEIIDETNSLIIFLKNLCNFDLEKKQYINNNKEIVIDSDNKNNSSINNFNNFLSNFSNDEASVIKNVAIKQIILEKLKQEKENGTIYIYKTKPKKIIYLKWIINFLFIILFFSFLIIGILFGIVISIPKNTDGYTIFDSIIYIICGSFIGISTLKNILEIFGINADKNILKKNKKNENYIYSFPISRIIICIVSATICLFSNLLKSSNNESIIVFIFSNFNSDTIYLLFFIFYLISLASIILIVIGVFFGKNIAPKENEELKKKLIREYELKLKKESIDKKDSTNNKRK